MSIAQDIKILSKAQDRISLELLLASTPHLVFGVDKNFECIFTNQKALIEVELNTAEIEKKSTKDLGIFGSLLHPLFEKVLKGEDYQTEEHEILTTKGNKWFEFHVNKILDEHDQIIGALAFIHDLTSRKQKEMELTELRAKLEAQMKALDVFDIVAETDRRGKITYVNDQFIAISKYSREELIGQDHRIINSSFHPKSFFRDMWASISQGKIWSGEIRNRAKDGTIYWVSTVITPILDSAGKIKSFLAIRRDITKQKETEESIKESELRFRELLDNVNLKAVGLDVRGRVTFANSALLNFLGKQQEEVLGKDWFNDFITQASRDQIFEIFSRTLTDDKTSEDYECELVASNGEARIIRWKNTLFRDQKGDLIGVTVLGEDVTEQKAAEHRIAELRDKNERQKEEIMGFVSHELRSPINSIIVSVEILKNYLKGEGYGAKVPPDETLRQIQHQTERILRVSKDFMECSIHKAGEMHFELKPTHLNKLLKNICNSFAHQLALKQNLSLHYDAPDVEIVGHWDANRLDQVFTNLISNAIKYSKPESKKIEIQSTVKNGAVHITISDDGIGIPEEGLKNLFQLFSRADNARDTAAGFGLGLKISRDIIEKHGGKIWAESKLNEGSKFHVVLPLQWSKASSN